MSPLVVPCLFGGLVVGMVSSYVLGPWAGIVVAVILLAAIGFAISRPTHREAAGAAVIGAVIGFVGVMLLALLSVLSH